MSNTEKTVTYTTENTYLTQNELTPKTKNVWLVFHGYGYLSRYFVKYFNGLNAEENYIIVPQAPSKYYLKNEFKYVGASWLTKENTTTEINNVLSYIDAVLDAESLPNNVNFILFGFSQGVSVAARWLTQRKMNCKLVVLYAGGIPNELTPTDFEFLDFDETKIKIIYGDNDEFLTPERLEAEHVKYENLFQGKAEVINFEGTHEVKPEIIEGLI
ncbi:alpha/beta hydrolase [Flagellimonas zhangzhouensis]|uniref:Predicted esterase n=1 Tax=Flagellimonas zhangzhouensis TaxID=1073328 RepID=A0A1H2SVM3_9FLAO|nr:esterase [Allomuricauda zhangzhouensis]SDQ80084.1 Predicted esterase [Allomuricauda zhangzhouensis]SDW35640.1 Predicted esterase [Allomuricauda zhangzhouensis]